MTEWRNDDAAATEPAAVRHPAASRAAAGIRAARIRWVRSAGARWLAAAGAPAGAAPGKLIAAVVAAAVVAVALVTAGVVFLTGADDGKDKTAGKGEPPASSTEKPSGERSEESSDGPADDGSATDFPTPDWEDGLPSKGPDKDPDESASDVPLPSFMLQVGDCYDRSDKAGSVETRECDGAHDAEVVSRKKITGDYGTDSAVRRKADSLCRSSLKDKAAKQPGGVIGGTLISYPKASGVNGGINSVTCSLTAGKGKKLHKPLV